MSAAPPPPRPGVSVVVPFGGDVAEAGAALEAMARLEVRGDDELLLVDNTPTGALARPTRAGVTIVPAPERASAYYARNAGAAHSTRDWVLFVDSDCEPASHLLDVYFAPPPDGETGALAGAVRHARDQGALAARYAAARDLLSQERGSAYPYLPTAVTANLLVRRSVWTELGGFADDVHSGADTDFCWRLQRAGHRLDYRPDAWVAHRHRESVTGLLRQKARDAAGRAWLEERYPGSFEPLRPVRNGARAGTAALWWLLRGERERGLFRALDGACVLAEGLGYALGRRSSP